MINYFKSIKNNLISSHENDMTDNTISGSDLDTNMTNRLNEILIFLPFEKIEIIYSDTNKFDVDDIDHTVLVGITNYRIFKLEGSDITSVFRNIIQSITHQKNGILRWDKIECHLKDGIETFGIFHRNACAYFCEYLNNMLFLNPLDILNFPKPIDQIMPNISNNTNIQDNQIEGVVNTQIVSPIITPIVATLNEIPIIVPTLAPIQCKQNDMSNDYIFVE